MNDHPELFYVLGGSPGYSYSTQTNTVKIVKIRGVKQNGEAYSY